MQKIRDKLRLEWLKLIGHNVDVVIKTLNPIIRGQANYYRTGVSTETFNNLDKWMFQRQCRYTKRIHPKKNWKWRQQRYWGRLNLDRQDNWVFGNKQTGRHLLKFSWFNIERHILVKGKSSPDDPSLKEYWKQRNLAKAKDHAKSIQSYCSKTRLCLSNMWRTSVQRRRNPQTSQNPKNCWR